MVKLVKEKVFHSSQVRDSSESNNTLNVNKSSRIGHPFKNNITSRSLENRALFKLRVLRDGSETGEKISSRLKQ
jgi:hypothetical protein